MKIEELETKFVCPKCHAKNPVLGEYSLPKVAHKLPLPVLDKFLLVSCSLCGYTEMYNMKIIERVRSESHQTAVQGVAEKQQAGG